MDNFLIINSLPVLTFNREYVVTKVCRDKVNDARIHQLYISPLVKDDMGWVCKVQGKWVSSAVVELLIIGGASVFPARYDGTFLTLGAELETELRASHNSDGSETPKLSELPEGYPPEE